MPTQFGFNVSIVSGEDNIVDRDRLPYTEFGTKILNAHTAGEQTVSTKIESKTGSKIFVRIRCIGPLPTGALLTPSSYVFQNSTSSGNVALEGNGSHLLPYDLTEVEDVPFGIGIRVYIDGNPKAEQDSIVRQVSPRRFILVRGRTVPAGRDMAGKTVIETKGWMFSELGIEVQMNSLRIADDINHNSNAAREQNQAGQIVVRLDRCLVSGVTNRMSKDCIGSSDSMSGRLSEDATHEMKLAGNTVANYAFEGTTTRPYIQGEDVYASYIFQYMDRAKLMKLGLCDQHGIPISKDAVSSPTDVSTGNATSKGLKRKLSTDEASMGRSMTMTLRPRLA